jgi:polyisoprenoid-binding protein YceI
MQSILLRSALPLAVLSSSLLASPFAPDLEHSALTVHVHATAHSFEVAADAFSTQIELDEDLTKTRAEIHIPISALHSGNHSRDEEMVEWIESQEFPEVTFVLNSVTGTAEHPVGHGELTLHGVKHEVEVPFTVGIQDGHRVIRGSAVVEYDEYGLEVIRKFLLKVRPTLEIEFNLVEAETVLDESSH